LTVNDSLNAGDRINLKSVSPPNWCSPATNQITPPTPGTGKLVLAKDTGEIEEILTGLNFPAGNKSALNLLLEGAWKRTPETSPAIPPGQRHVVGSDILTSTGPKAAGTAKILSIGLAEDQTQGRTRGWRPYSGIEPTLQFENSGLNVLFSPASEVKDRYPRLRLSAAIEGVRIDAAQFPVRELEPETTRGIVPSMRQTHPQAAQSATSHGTTFGRLLKQWRGRRGFAQLDLAVAARTTQRHLSFIESGRAKTSREMILRLAANVVGKCIRARERHCRICDRSVAHVDPRLCSSRRRASQGRLAKPMGSRCRAAPGLARTQREDDRNSRVWQDRSSGGSP
jgi:hypothetical protein